MSHTQVNIQVLMRTFSSLISPEFYRHATLKVAEHLTCSSKFRTCNFADVRVQIVRNGCSITVLAVIWMRASHFLPSWQIWNHANAMHFTCHKQPAGFWTAHDLLKNMPHPKRHASSRTCFSVLPLSYTLYVLCVCI